MRLEINGSAEQALGDETLRDNRPRPSQSPCPPHFAQTRLASGHKQEKATHTVLEQAEVLSEGWTMA